jgi:hypothetical protein
MLNKKHSLLIIKHIDSLTFVDSVNEDEIEFYLKDENIQNQYIQLDFTDVYIDDRVAIMDDKKNKKLKALLKKDDEIPELNVDFSRTDAYPNGMASYSVIVYIPY